MSDDSTALERKVAAVVSVDVANYSRNTEADEALSVKQVMALQGTIDRITQSHGGRIFNTSGDGFMLEFASGASAVEAIVELARHCQPPVRIGGHLADAFAKPDGDLLSHGVNITARLRELSSPGSAVISGSLHQATRVSASKLFEPIGQVPLSKMSETIDAYKLVTSPPKPSRTSDRLPRLLWGAAMLFVSLVSIALFAWPSKAPSSPTVPVIASKRSGVVAACKPSDIEIDGATSRGSAKPQGTATVYFQGTIHSKQDRPVEVTWVRLQLFVGRKRDDAPSNGVNNPPPNALDPNATQQGRITWQRILDEVRIHPASKYSVRTNAPHFAGAQMRYGGQGTQTLKPDGTSQMGSSFEAGMDADTWYGVIVSAGTDGVRDDTCISHFLDYRAVRDLP